MSDITIPDAPPALRELLKQLPNATGGLIISQHYNDPQPNEWFCGWGSAGDIGPYESAETALFAGIRWIHTLYEEARAEADEHYRANADDTA